MALGFAKIIGIRLTVNFQRPFFATTISEFWQRWHISLSSWFRDYVYTPIRFNLRRRRTLGIIVPTVISFILIGLWHKLSANFLIIGILHGCAVSAESFAKKKNPDYGSPNHWATITMLRIGTFSFVALTLIFFRSESLLASKNFFQGFFQFKTSDLSLLLSQTNKLDILILITAIPLIEHCTRKGMLDNETGQSTLDQIPKFKRWALYSILTSTIIVLGIHNHSPFIYATF